MTQARRSEDDAEYIVAKAIHDGVIDAVIDRTQRFVYSRESADIYSTSEPQTALHRRIQFCMDVRTGAVKVSTASGPCCVSIVCCAQCARRRRCGTRRTRSSV